METKREIYTGAPVGGTLRSKLETCYATTETTSCTFDPTATVNFPRRTIYSKTTIDPTTASHTKLALVNFDAFGSPTSASEYDFDSSTAFRKSTTTYTNPGNGLHLPSTVTVYDGGGTQKAKVTYSYDAASALFSTSGVVQKDGVTGARGNLTSVTHWSNGATDPVTSYTYWDTGMLKSISDAATHVTSFDYTDNFQDGNHNAQAFLHTVTNALSQVVATNQYHWPSGALLNTQDANGVYTNYSYDPLMRRTTTSVSKGATTYASTTTVYTDGAASMIEVQGVIDGTKTSKTRAYLDGYGRTIRSGAYNGTNYDLADTCYDTLGRLVFVSGPFQDDPSTATSKCASYASSPSTTEGTESAYDTLGRVTSTTARAYDANSSTWVNRTTYTTYTGNSIQIADAGNGTRPISKISKFDGLSRLAAVCEVSSDTQLGNSTTPDCGSSGFDISGTGFKTTYTYDTLDHLTQVTQGSMANRTYTYNALGQLTNVTTPESGTTKFSYNSDGLTSQRIRAKANQANACPFSPYDSAKCVTTTYSYDALHRLTQQSYDDGTTTTASFAYDLASDAGVSFTNYIGRLGRAVAGQSKSWFSYDEMGGVKSNWQMLPPQYNVTSFQMTYTYDSAGDVLTFNNSYTNFTYTYDVRQRLTTVAGGWCSMTRPCTMFSNPVYGRFGIGSYIVGGSINSGVQTVLNYNNFGELTSKYATSSGGSGTTRFSMAPINYAPNGMIIGETVNSSSWTHVYDDMGRILTSQNGSTVTYGYQYDRYGNRWHQNVTGAGIQVDMPTDNTTNRISTTGITQDALGNITQDGSQSYTYDAENRIIQVDGGSTATYVYDAFNRRVQRITGGTTYNYTYDLANNVAMVYSGTSTPLTAVRAELFLGRTHLATYTPTHTYFHHQNWLGSRSTTTDETGAKAQDCEWNSFGQLPRDASNHPVCSSNSAPDSITPYGYADYERDSETELDHMQYRYYNSRIGRFMGADLLSGDGNYPQTLNKFGYTTNNPTNRYDPSGLNGLPVAGPLGPPIDTSMVFIGNGGGGCGGCTIPGTTAYAAYHDPAAFNPFPGIDPSGMNITTSYAGGGQGTGGGGSQQSGDTQPPPGVSDTFEGTAALMGLQRFQESQATRLRVTEFEPRGVDRASGRDVYASYDQADVALGMDIFHESAACRGCGSTWRQSETTGNVFAVLALAIPVALIGAAEAAVAFDAACGRMGINANYQHLTLYCTNFGNVASIGYDPKNGLHLGLLPDPKGRSLIHVPLDPRRWF